MKVRIVALCGAFAIGTLLFGASSAMGQVVAEGVIDHYLCHKVKDLKSPQFVKLTNISVADAQSKYDGVVSTKKLWLVCMPAQKDPLGGPLDPNSLTLINPAALLCAYKVSGDPAIFEPRPAISVTSQFQGHSVELKKPFLLMAPCDQI